MPGKNSKFDKSKVGILDRIFLVNAYLWIGLIILIVELIGMFRGYYVWNDRKHTMESYILTAFWIICDI